MRAIKNRAFSVFKANFHALKPPKSFWKWFSIKNMKLEQQLLVKYFFVSMIFDKLYLVKIGPIFDGSQLSCVTFHYKILSVCSFGCKNLLNSNRQSANFHNRHHTNVHLLRGVCCKITKSHCLILGHSQAMFISIDN